MNAPTRTTSTADPTLDPAHEHEWVLRGVDFEDTGSVYHYGCACGQVWFE